MTPHSGFSRVNKTTSSATRLLNSHLSSEFQGFGRCALEAMACGAACVLTHLGGVLEYARHEDNALLAPPGQADQLADAILRLLDDPPLRQRLIASGLTTAARFCHRREARDTLAWIERVLAAGTTA